MTWFGRRRKEKAVRARLSVPADEIGARTGEVLGEHFSGGMGSPLSLVIVSLPPSRGYLRLHPRRPMDSGHGDATVRLNAKEHRPPAGIRP
ncbi:hypothetical protein [Amycolatopsis sp. TNS106]|uniref:hypothetical protein n=1 Tax=Amycolatopsis sp. TNS106 TaxID=2861750 RepID=UPI001C59AB3B|nr:hypothetical protein [Amycolatopsis sp. TNS106]